MLTIETKKAAYTLMKGRYTFPLRTNFNFHRSKIKLNKIEAICVNKLQKKKTPSKLLKVYKVM